MDFWKSVQAAAEKAASAAKDLGKKGLEVVEATAEEASKKMNLNEKVGAGPAKQEPPSQAELEAFGITPAFAEFVSTMNYSAFRDFPAEHLLSPSEGSSSSGGAGSPAYQLNPWQVRHAMLVVQALKEVNELRFVLCPKYMTDEHFWHIYFTLARKYLPDKAYTWAATDNLPTFRGSEAAQDDGFSLAGLGSQLMRLGSQLQSAATTAPAAGLELTSFGLGSSSAVGSIAQPALEQPASSAGAGVGVANGNAALSGVLEEDPDLEAYLQVAISEGQGGSQEGEEGSGYDVGADGDDDLDLDSYINECIEEVEAAALADKGSSTEEHAVDATKH